MPGVLMYDTSITFIIVKENNNISISDCKYQTVRNTLLDDLGLFFV